LKKVQGSLARANGTFANPSGDFNGLLTEIKALGAKYDCYTKSNVTFVAGL
jgi:hypothetical protein